MGEWIPSKGKYAITELSGATAGPGGMMGVGQTVNASTPSFGIPGQAPAQSSGRGVPSEKIFVAGLPLQANDESVRTMFGAYGQVQDCKVLPENGRPNKAALVRMATMEQASQVIQQVNGSVVPGTGQQLVVRFADNPGSAAVRVSSPVMPVQPPSWAQQFQGLQGQMQSQTGFAQSTYGEIPPEGQHVPAHFSPYGTGAATTPDFTAQAQATQGTPGFSV